MSKVAFITGAGGYIGGECAVTLAKQGAKIAVCDINEEKIANTVKRVEKVGGKAIGYRADVTDPKNIEEVINRAYEELLGLDAMVHVAGGSSRIAGPEAKFLPLVEQEDYIINTVINVNLMGAIWASRAAAKIMIKEGKGGKIINFSSAVGINGLVGCCDYAAAKGGVMSFTKSLAKELGPYGINVNSVAPGVVMRPEEGNSSDRALCTNLLGKKCLASDIANLVEFLTSDKAGFITGQTYVCDGGRTLSMKGTD